MSDEIKVNSENTPPRKNLATLGQVKDALDKRDEKISSLKSDLSHIAEIPIRDTTNYIDLSVDNMIVVDTSVIPEVSVSGNTVTLTQPSRANVKVAFPITVDNTDTVYDIKVESSEDLLTNLAKVEIHKNVTSGVQGIAVEPVLSTEDYRVWSGQGAFKGNGQKYLYILLPYTIPSSTFEISIIKKAADENIYVKKEAIVDIGYDNFDKTTKERMTNVDYLVGRIGSDLSKKTLVVLNFEETCDDWYADRQALLEQYGFKGSFALSGTLTTQEQIARLHDLVNKGHDIAIYSGSTNGRPDDVNDTSKQAEWDSYIEYIVNIAKNYGIHNPVAYHCKYNLLGTALYNSLLKYGFKIARCSNASDFGFDDNDSDKCIKTFDKIMTVANTNSFSSDSNGSTPHIWFIDRAIQNGWDIAFFGHGMEDVDINTDLSDSVHFKKFILVDICEHLKQCIENGTVEVVTWAEYYKIRSGN